MGLDITAQVMVTFSCNGHKVLVSAFIQPESEQHCPIGMNVIPLKVLLSGVQMGNPCMPYLSGKLRFSWYK